MHRPDTVDPARGGSHPAWCWAPDSRVAVAPAPQPLILSSSSVPQSPQTHPLQPEDKHWSPVELPVSAERSESSTSSWDPVPATPTSDCVLRCRCQLKASYERRASFMPTLCARHGPCSAEASAEASPTPSCFPAHLRVLLAWMPTRQCPGLDQDSRGPHTVSRLCFPEPLVQSHILYSVSCPAITDAPRASSPDHCHITGREEKAGQH